MWQKLLGVEPRKYKLRLGEVTVERRFDPFLMRYVNPRVRGMGGSMDVPEWYWQKGDVGNLIFSLVPHPKPVPAAMVDPGETCLQIKAGPGAQSIFQYAPDSHGAEDYQRLAAEITSPRS